MPKLFASLVLGTLLAGSGVAVAASGTAMGVDPAAEAQGSQTRTLVVGSDIFIGDRIVTGPQGQVQILFEDRTELVVGPRSALLIEDYLLRENGSAGRLAIDALSGTFRFVTGGAPKDRYVITTPTGTIGVRGTAFDLYVEPGDTSVLLYHGAVRICSSAGECADLAASCEVGQYTASEAVVVGQTDDIAGEARDVLKTMFRYALSQQPLLRAFRVAGAEQCLRRPADAGAPGSLSDPGTEGTPGPRGTTGGGPTPTPTPTPSPDPAPTPDPTPPCRRCSIN